MNRLRLFIVAFNLLLVSLIECLGQDFAFPIFPNQKCYLFGNLAEIRTNHFHTGLDIAGQVGDKVYASADGYISRVKVSTYGYGKVIYLQHPTLNRQTVYAHLSGFEDKLADFVRTKQYEQEAFELDIELMPHQFPVKKGEWIAQVGNTGSSTGPHLHYEIRDTADNALNPLKVGFKEITPDKLPPILQTIAIVPLQIDSRVAGVFERKEMKLKKIGANLYQVEQVVEAFGEIGLELMMKDMMTGTTASFGVNRIEMWVEEEKHISILLDKVPHSLNQQMNVFINYAHLKKTGKAFHKCYVSDGNELFDMYKILKNKGNIRIKPNKKYQIRIEVQDSAGNSSKLFFKIIGKKQFIRTNKRGFYPVKDSFHYRVQENTLAIEISSSYPERDTMNLYFNGIAYPLNMAYQDTPKMVFLWDLRKGMPDYAEIGGMRIPFYFQKMIPPKQQQTFETENVAIFFAKESLYDTLYLEIKKLEHSLMIGNAEIPLNQSIISKWKIPSYFGLDSKISVYTSNKKFLKVSKDSLQITWAMDNLGWVNLWRDETPPEIKLLKSSKNYLSFKIQDDLSGIQSFKATLNGRFLLMNYESKTQTIETEKRQRNFTWGGDFRLEVKDNMGNIQFYQRKI